MRLTVVGCSGSYPGPASPASCYLLEADPDRPGGRPWRVLLDLGNGALGALHRYADPLVIDAVLLSHLHADHCLDLCGYYVLRKYHPDGHQPRIPVWGPDGTSRRLAAAYDLPSEPGMGEEFDFRDYPAGPFEVGPFAVSVVRVNHPVPAYAIRVVHGGRTLVYSGDTAVTPALDAHAEGADLLLCEASFLDTADNPPDVHLTGSQAGSVAAAAGVGRLLLTHVPPWHDPEQALAEARTTYGGDAGLAVAGQTYEV